MIRLLFTLSLLLICADALFAQSGVMVYEPGTRGTEVRVIERGKGQEFDQAFTDFKSFHFVQFGVYPPTIDREEILAPSQVGQSWLIYHNETLIKGYEENGAYYIVKPFSSAEEARTKAEEYKKQGIQCWYNFNLTDAPFVLLSVSLP